MMKLCAEIEVLENRQVTDWMEGWKVSGVPWQMNQVWGIIQESCVTGVWLTSWVVSSPHYSFPNILKIMSCLLSTTVSSHFLWVQVLWLQYSWWFPIHNLFFSSWGTMSTTLLCIKWWSAVICCNSRPVYKVTSVQFPLQSAVHVSYMYLYWFYRDAFHDLPKMSKDKV